MNFYNFSFNPQIDAGISAAGYRLPTPIQSKTIPVILEGKDLLGLAQTGTGKTAAFVLPIMQHLIRGPRGKLRALILSPTRELAEQTNTFIRQLGRETGLRSLSVYGGVGLKPQINSLRNGVDIVVACPGRLLDLHDQKAIDLSKVEILVIDEADQMFDMGFLPSIKKIISKLTGRRQTLLFSATMSDPIRDLATRILIDPVTVEISITKPLASINHSMYLVDPTRKNEILLKLLDTTGKGQVLVFTRTKHRAKKIAFQLTQAGLSSTSLQGNLSQQQRDKAMNSFRTGSVKILVATDIAARGIDVSQVSHVINYDVPDTAEAYTHRTGRTGRMEKLGSAISLVTQDDLQMIRTIERQMGAVIELRKLDGYEVDFLKINPATHGKENGRVIPNQTRKPQSSQPRTYNKNRFHFLTGNNR